MPQFSLHFDVISKNKKQKNKNKKIFKAKCHSFLRILMWFQKIKRFSIFYILLCQCHFDRPSAGPPEAHGPHDGPPEAHGPPDEPRGHCPPCLPPSRWPCTYYNLGTNKNLCKNDVEKSLRRFGMLCFLCTDKFRNNSWKIFVF